MVRAIVVVVIAAVVAASPAAGALAQTPKRGGTLVFAVVPPEPACLNVIVSRCGTGTARISLLMVSSKVLEAPFEVGLDSMWRPRLVTHVGFTRKRPFTLTYHIRPEARWSDGVPVSARDFLFTLRMVRAHGTEESRALHRVVRTIRAVDPKTVRVVLRPRVAGWRGLFGSILPAHALRGRDLASAWTDRIDNPRTGRPIGSGPFLVERWDRGRLALVRNPGYWERRPHLDRLVVRFGVDGNTLVDSFRRGEFHIALNPTTGFFSELRRQPGLTMVSAPGPSWEHLEIRVGPGGHSALRDKRVRRALAHGIDRVGIGRALFGEIDRNLPPSDSAIYLLQSRHYRPNWSGYRYRPAEARRLLEQAGCRRGADGIYACADQRLSIRITSPVVPGGFRPRAIELLQGQLRQAGVEVVPSFAPQAAIFGRPGGILPRGGFDLALFSWTSIGPDPGRSSIFGCGRELNYTGYCQRLVTRDLDQADRILDASQRARVLNRADRQLALDVPVIPLFQPPIWAALTPAVRNFALATPFNGLVNAEDWWLDR